HQLAVRHSQEETRRGRPILFRSLAVLGVLAALCVGASLAVHYVRIPDVKTPDERSPAPADNPSPSVAPPQPAPQASPSAAVLPPTPEPAKPQAAPAVPTPAPLRPEQMPQPKIGRA